MTTLVLFNTVLSPLAILVLIFVDYQKKKSTDTFQKRIVLGLLAFTFTAILSDIANSLLSGRPGALCHGLLYGVNSLYYVAQITAYYMVALFIDYHSHSNQKRTENMAKGILVILLLNLLLLVLNLWGKFYFYITPDNHFVHGSRYYIRLIISYFAPVTAFGDIFLAIKERKSSTLVIAAFFVFFTGIGASVDLLTPEYTVFVWPCFSASLLFAYFFIIKGDSLLDPLTGIGNRHSFNEFVKSISLSRESYSMAFMDIDDFKGINDTHGHLAGDEALKYFAGVLKHSVRNTDFLARYGGDEFIIATKNRDDLEKIMERINSLLREDNRRAGRLYKLKISCGFDSYPSGEHSSFEAFLSHIDSLMYKNKEERKKCFDAEESFFEDGR